MKLTKSLFALAISLGYMHGQQVHYYGAVDLGAKGTKGYLYAFEKEAEGHDARVIFGKTINTALVSGAEMTKKPDGSSQMRFTAKGIAEAADAVKTLFTSIKASAAENSLAIQRNAAAARKSVAGLRASLATAKAAATPNPAEIKTLQANINAAEAGIRTMDGRVKGLGAVDFYVVGSSGVAKGVNTPDLAAAVKDSTGGIDMVFVNAAEEARYGLISAVPYSYRANSIMIDIGSGNTKLGCMAGDSFKSAEIAFGSVTGRKWALDWVETEEKAEAARKASGAPAGTPAHAVDFPAGIDVLVKTKIGPSYKQETMNYPCLANRAHLFWVGGAAWATATFMHPEKSLAGYVIMSRAEVETFAGRLKDGTWNAPPPPLTLPKEVDAKTKEEIRKKNESERADVMNVFVGEDLQSGVGVLRSVLNASNGAADVIFARNGNYLFGYALEHYQVDRDGAATSGPVVVPVDRKGPPKK